MKTTFKFLSLSFVLLTLACTAKGAATLYNVDIGTLAAYTGQGLLGGVSDTTWTKAPAAASGLALSTSTGAGSSVTLTNSGIDNIWSGDPPTNNFAGWTNFGDYAYIYNHPATLTISGLNPSDTFTFYLYAQAGNPAYNLAANINGGSSQTTAGGVPNNGTWTLGPSSPSNYLVLTGTVPLDGILTVNISPNVLPNNEQNINGFQLEVVPEPSTWALLAGSLAILTVFRRRRA